MSVNVLISSAGRRGELVKIFRKSLDTAGLQGKIFAIDRSAYSAAGWLSDGLDLVPSISDDSFIESVMEVCARRGIRHIVPTLDPELPLYAAARAEFAERGITVWVSSPETVRIARDKRATYEWLRGQGFPTVSQRDLENAADLALPLIAKHATGSSSIGLRRIDDWSELPSGDTGDAYIVQNVAPGIEYTVDVLVDRRGAVRSVVPRQRLETRAGEVSKGMTAHVPDLEGLAAEIAGALPGAFGVLNVQIFRDPHSAELNVIEVNARFGGGFPLSWEAGAHMPAWLLQDLEGIEPTASLTWVADKLMLRYDAAVFLDAPR